MTAGAQPVQPFFITPNRKLAMASTANTRNRILPMPAALAAMPPKPNKAAIRAMATKTVDY